MKSKKLTKVLLMVGTIILMLGLAGLVCYAATPIPQGGGADLSGYKGFTELKTLLKDILTIVAGFMAIIAVIFFAYSMVGDRPEQKLTSLKLMAGGGLIFMLAQGIDKFF